VLAAKTAEISQKTIAARSADDAARADLNAQIATHRDEQVRIADRLNAVVQAFADRGGDAEPYEKYVAASTRVSIDATDVGGTLDFATRWVTSPEGGIRVAINVVKFVVTLIAFWILARVLAGIVRRTLSRMRRTSDLLRDFFINTVRKVTFFIGIVVALSMLEVNVGPFVAAIGAAGFIIGFALQGTLSNFAAGIMILV
jgi:small conductance mechanosensitive channel